MNTLKQVKVYVDTCVLSNLREGKIAQNNLIALDKLCDYEDIDLVTSKKMLEEFLNTKDDQIRIALKVLYKIITKIPSESLLTYHPAVMGGFTLGSATLGGGFYREDILFTELNQLFDQADAEHIFQAVKAECDYFLTVDYNTILKRVPKYQAYIDKICPILKFVDPACLLEKIE